MPRACRHACSSLAHLLVDLPCINISVDAVGQQLRRGPLQEAAHKAVGSAVVNPGWLICIGPCVGAEQDLGAVCIQSGVQYCPPKQSLCRLGGE